MLCGSDVCNRLAGIEGAVFDLDGTLIDSFESIYDAYNEVMKYYGKPSIPLRELKPTIGVPLREVLPCYLEPELVDEAISIYRTRLDENLFECSVMPGARELLFALAERDISCGIVTNKPARMAKLILEHYALDKYFGIVLGLDDFEKPKPDPEGLFRSMSYLGLTASKCMYIGDSVVDVLTGKAAGTLSLAVSTGASTEEELESAGADFVFRDLSELGEYVEDCADWGYQQDRASGLRA